MGSLIAYSGVTTKIHAMGGKLLTERQFREMSALESVPEAVEYLKKQPAYEDIFRNIDDTELHRAYIEEHLLLSKYRDYAKLYRFSGISGRKFLEFYFMHYEISLLKKCLRQVLDHRQTPLDLSFCQDFFDRHSVIDFKTLTASASIEEFISHLQGSIYYDTMEKVASADSHTLFDYEVHLDMIYFNYIWKNKNGFLSKAEQSILTECFGSKLDLLNIQWIYRSKKYYRLASADIYSLLIPVNYKLGKNEIRAMVESAGIDEFYAQLGKCRYGKITSSSDNAPDLENLYEQVMRRIYTLTMHKDPYSIASLNSYLYFKENEIQKIITTIETIRYRSH